VPADASYHAIYVVLNDGEFFPASLRSIYPHITGATVITSYDRDRWNSEVTPEPVIPAILSRELDPDRKVNVVVCTEVSEARLRNRAMALARPPRKARHVLPEDEATTRIVDPDYFWIVDADEIYDDDNVARMKAYVASHRASVYLMYAHSYFRSWNWRVEERGHYLTLMKPDVWFGWLRHRFATWWTKPWQRLAHRHLLPEALAFRAFGTRFIPREVAVFHHGNYVGGRDRIEAKVASSGHRAEMMSRWMVDVWDHWTPETTNFHPTTPENFPSATYVPTSELPKAIVEHEWPAGWIDR
jgi:hypothetical protein